jgi:phage I-like protein
MRSTRAGSWAFCMSDATHDLAEIAAKGATFRLFNEVAFAEVPATIPVFPKPGAYKHGSYGSVSLTPERIANFVSNFNAGVYQKHIPIDAEHKSKLSGALGYINALVVQDDGRVDAAVEWTDRGQRLVANDRFKYVSPEWFDRWEQPDTEVEFQDVLVGLALTTRPFFKDANDSLRPLVAREGELIAPPTEEVTGAHMTEPTTRTGSRKDARMEFTEQQFTELQGKVEDLTQKFNDADAARKAAETLATTAQDQAKTFAEQIGQLQSERRRDGFIAEITGKSPANNLRWFGEVETHVSVLESLSDDLRPKYIEQQRAIAAQVKTFTGPGMGSDGTTADTSALGAINRKAKEIRASRPELTEAQSFTEAMDADKELARRYMAERRSNRTEE